MRLFTAIEIPEEIKKQLYRQANKFQSLNPVRQEQLHLTLRFLGEVDALRLPEINSALRSIHSTPIRLQITGTGFFPSPKHPQIFWIGVTAPPVLAELKIAIDNALAPLLPDQENRKFVPHITLFRFKKRPSFSTLSALNEDFRVIKPEPFMVKEFHLYSSELKNTGAVHELQESFPLSL